MSEAKFGSAGVSTREIDQSGPRTVDIVGIPAGVIGTANKGPAFVPLTFGNDKDFYARFGKTDGTKFGPLAVSEWLRNASAATFVRVLGVGTGKARLASAPNAGSVESAGYVVGGNNPDNSGALAANPFANTSGLPGRTYFLGCFMSESAGSTVLSDAGIQTSAAAAPLIRGMLFAASGVIPRMSSSFTGSVAPDPTLVATNSSANGSIFGSVKLLDTAAKQEFVLLLNGHKGTDSRYPNVITASFDMTAQNYFANVLNSDPLQTNAAGHCLYKFWNVHPALATATGSNALTVSGALNLGGTILEQIGFLTTGSADYNAGSATVPNYENFATRFEHAKTPWVVSQKFGGLATNLFKLHSIDDGVFGHSKLKFSIENITPSDDGLDQYGSFDLVIRDATDTDANPKVLERFSGINLNPNSDRYMAKVVGDQNIYFDFDRDTVSQRLVVDGNYDNRSTFVRVEMSADVDNGEADPTALPVGFRGYPHLVTSGSAPLTSPASIYHVAGGSALKSAVQPPVPFRSSISNGSGITTSVNTALYWGVQFEQATSPTTLNSNQTLNKSIENFGKYLPDFQTLYANVVAYDNAGVADTAANGVIDADRFQYGAFSLENVQVVTGSDGNADANQWQNAVYVRNGNIVANSANKTRAFKTSDLTTTNRRFAKFSFFMFGGFDGVNVFDADTTNMTNVAVSEEMNNASRGIQNGPTVVSYLKALQIVKNTSDVDVQLLAIPGMRHPVITDTAIQTVQDRFDALFIMDPEEYDTLNTLLTGSSQVPSVNNTVQSFRNRSLDSSFASAYYPDVVMTDPNTKTNVVAPPSVAVLGAFALNDNIGHPWFAPAGFARGALNIQEAKVKLSKINLDALYNASINPIVAFPGAVSGTPVVWGQKTLQVANSSLNRVNVRRLLINIRRSLRTIANRILFEPNREATLTNFSDAVKPILSKIQQQNGLEKFKVLIDTSTTTQADVENNTVRGKIFLQPTKTIEFVSLDFVVTNAGAEIK